MSQQHLRELRPFFSVLIGILFLFSLVFLKMEERRLGYSLLKLTRQQREIVDLKRQRNIELAKVTRPQQIERVAQNRMTLKEIEKHQIIHLFEADR